MKLLQLPRPASNALMLCDGLHASFKAGSFVNDDIYLYKSWESIEAVQVVIGLSMSVGMQVIGFFFLIDSQRWQQS